MGAEGSKSPRSKAKRLYISKKSYDPSAFREMMDRRNTIVEEIIATEATYVGGLELMMEVYVRPMEAYSWKKTTRKLFSCVSDLYTVHLSLLNSMQKKKRLWSDWQTISDVFIRHSELFRLYTTYINNYDVAITTLIGLESNSAFQKFLEEASEHHCVAQPLSAYMILPIQRMPRYVMLLNDLLKHTPEPHPDRKNTIVATKAIEKITAWINEEKRRAEDKIYMYELSNKFTTSGIILASATRRPVKEFDIMWGKEADTSKSAIKKILVTSKGKEPADKGSEPGLAKGGVKDGRLFFFNDSVLVARAVAPALRDRSSLMSIFNAPKDAWKLITCGSIEFVFTQHQLSRDEDGHALIKLYFEYPKKKQNERKFNQPVLIQLVGDALTIEDTIAEVKKAYKEDEGLVYKPMVSRGFFK